MPHSKKAPENEIPLRNQKTNLILPESYLSFLEDVKTRIQQSQIKAAVSVNQELIKLHWWIGKEITNRQEKEKWGSQVIEKFCKDIQSNFPGLKGFSRSNIFRMKSFYLSYTIVAQAARQLETPPEFCLNIPWWHNVILIEKVKNFQEREWYAKNTIEHGWSRSMLELWIESNLYHRKGKAPNNFQKTLPSPQSDLAEQTLRDPYNFDFMTLIQEAREKEIEDGLMTHIQKFLLELGSGFAFVGRQVPVRVEKEDYCLDLLFYHIKLRCYFIIELKAVPFKPEFTGQMNFYLAIVDDKIKSAEDNPTIGLILCKSKNSVTVKYALEGVLSPIGVASYETALADALPSDFKASLPTVEEIEAEAALFEKKTRILSKKINQMDYKGFLAEISYDDKAKIFLGHVIDLKNGITFQGKSIDELEKAFKDSVEAYLTEEEITTTHKNNKNEGLDIENALSLPIFQNQGYKGLYGGLDAKTIHQRKGLKKKQKIIDHMGITELSANLFTVTQTLEKLKTEQIKEKTKAHQTYFEVGQKVRKAIQELGGTMPEDLPITKDSTEVLQEKVTKEFGMEK